MDLIRTTYKLSAYLITTKRQRGQNLKERTMDKNKYYYDYTRNLPYEEEDAVPKYYKGTNGIEAYKVVENFQGNNYNLGTALTYLMRAGKKVYVNNSANESMVADIHKAIDHLKFELERIQNKTREGGQKV